MEEKIKNILKESIKVKEKLLKNQVGVIKEIAEVVIKSLKLGGKLILFGNGGSAADSQHIAAELVGRFSMERKPLPALALTANTSTLTALSNDYGYESAFAKQIEALGKKEDVALGISTSGNSPNVIRAIEKAKKMQIKTVGFTGGDGGKLKKIADISLVIPSTSTARIQEAHIVCAHAICELIERTLFKSQS